MRILALVLLSAALRAAEVVPDWVIRGIAMVETRSTWRDVGDVTYRDRRDGASGEAGFMQLAPSALATLRKTRLAKRCRTDVVLCESIAREYLTWLRAMAGSWEETVTMYNSGPIGSITAGRDYLHRVVAAGKRKE